MTTRHPNPDPDAIREAMNKIAVVVDADHGEPMLDMHEQEVIRPYDDECGTTACFAGWYLFADLHDKGEDHAFVDHTDHGTGCRFHALTVPVQHGGYMVHWDEGANAFARAVGFRHYEELEEWAALRPDLWGNPYGGDMFTRATAYGETPQGDEVTIHTVMEHWRNVAINIEDLRDPTT